MSLERLYQPPEIGAPGIRRGRRQRRDLVLAGLFVLAMAGVVAGVVLLNVPALFGGYPLRAYFPDAGGLDRGLDVVQEGFVIGHVGAVTPVFADAADRDQCPQSDMPRSAELPCFRATLRIQQDWPVPVGSEAQLAPAGFLGGNQIRIQPGLADERLAADAVIPTLPRQPDLPSQAALALTRLQSAIDETIRPALEDLQARIQGLIGALGPGEDGAGGAGAAAGEGLAEVFQNLRQLSADIEQTVDPERLGAILASVDALTANLATVSSGLDARSDDVGDAVQEYTALGADLRRVVNQAEPAVTDSLDDVQYLLQEISAALAPVLANIETASRNLAALTGDLREDPKSLLFKRPQQEPSPWLDR
ncbi:MlaD family protein [uncultured Thiohalocapsa sp.]|uniref:MlaD family protein n=1 Tax=uncultured Thiohalocapsa sp. TaxID=768990 RepID=UPI0025E7EAB6|nr:MlaD family protein [uncultured Thiohalocapsa sp.]